MSAVGVLGSPRSKLRIIVLLGLLATIWWPWCMSQMTYAIFVALASPARPSLELLWLSVYAPAFVLGFIAGLATSALSKEAPIKGWVVFCISLLVGAAFQSVLTGAAMSDCVMGYFGSIGNLFFWVGSLVCPVVAQLRRRGLGR
jgi:hypothetical protein